MSRAIRLRRQLSGWMLIAALAVAVEAAQPAPARQSTPAVDRRTAMIQARDGVNLYTEILMPRGAAGPLPILFLRTPYGAEARARNQFDAYLQDLARDGYIFVFQDVRGHYRSEGTFAMMRPPRDRSDPRAIDEGTDAYDTIEWLLANVPGHNGRVGMLGISYDGWLTVMAMLEPHPALAAVSPQAPPADMFIGDDFHHNGAFRLSYGFEYAYRMESTRESSAEFPFDRFDTFEWFLSLGPLANANTRYFKERLPTWNDFVAHPNYDAFWQRQASAPHLTRVTVPTLNVAGWWDQEDFYGPLKTYATLEGRDDARRNFIVIGPWNHGGWARGEGDRLGAIEFGSPTSRYFREEVQAPWFAHHLKGRPLDGWPEALTFQAGGKKWQRHDAWPPRRGTTTRSLYVHADRRLSFDAPTADGDNAFDSYISDPAQPVPYRQRPIEPTYGSHPRRWPAWLVEDQRFAHLRPDVVSWETEPLAEDLVVTGRLEARLFASTSGTDSDWIVKLIDVYPDTAPTEPAMRGYQLMVANDVFRGRFRKSFERPEPIPANTVQEYAIDLHAADYRFLRGHRVLVQVQSTWFPLIDRNPQTYVPNIFLAKPSDFRPATQRIYRSRRHPTHLVLPVAQ